MPAGIPVLQVQVVAAAKPWWRSRTLWLNAAALALAGAEAHAHLLQPLLPLNVYALAAFGLPIANALLRLVTTRPLSAARGAGRAPITADAGTGAIDAVGAAKADVDPFVDTVATVGRTA